MSWEIWGPAILSGLVTSGVGGMIVKTIVENSVAFKFDQQLEKLRSDLRVKETEISDLKSGALSISSSRHADIDRRRVEAASRLWEATISQKKYHTAASIVARLNLQEIQKSSANNYDMQEKMKLFGEGMFAMSGLANENNKEIGIRPDFDRLFLPHNAWICFEAMRSIGSSAIATLAALKAGAPLSILKDSSELNEKLILALPHQADFLKKYPDSGGFYLLGELEARIFTVLIEFLNANDIDIKAIEAAKEIVARAKNAEVPELPAEVPENFKLDPPPINEFL